MMRWWMALGFCSAVAVCFGGAGCNGEGDEGGATNCSASVPASCPSPAPSYATDVAPLLQKYCASCHAAGGVQASKPLDTYAGASAASGEMKHEVSGCEMPPADATQPTDAERETILGWIVCGAQNN